MQVHIINLDRSTERMAEFRRLNDHVDIVRCPAVDGMTIDLMDAGFVEHFMPPPYTPGALGCAMSHRTMWSCAVAEQRALTIAEDDAILHPSFAWRANELIELMPGYDSNWDLILWGWNFSHPLVFDMMPGVSPCGAYLSEQDMRAGVEQYRSLALSPQLFRLVRAFGIPCYSISPAGALKLRTACFPLRDGAVPWPGSDKPYRNTGIDVMMNSTYDKQLKAYVCVPPLAITRNEDSTTQVPQLKAATSRRP